jgi:nucleotide-binding universal stress UspA family protein
VNAAFVIKRILVATDYSNAARRAVWRAGDLARKHGAQLHLIHAQPDWNLFSMNAAATAEQFKAVTAHADQALRNELAWLETTFGINARGENRIGRASQVLRSVIAEYEPHLMVAGAHGEHDSPPMAPLLGGTAAKLIAFSAVPTLIVRGHEQSYRVALAAIERPGDASLQLLEWAHLLIPSGECHLVHAFSAPYAARMRAHGVPEASVRACEADIRKSGSAIVEELLSMSGYDELRLHAHLINGEPVGAVLTEIASSKPDLVILGKHRHPPRDVHLASFGSVAFRIAYHAPCDVLVVS